MSRRTIEVNVLSKKSINSAIKELREYAKEIENQKIDEFMDKVALKMCTIINNRFLAVDRGKNPNVTIARYERDGHSRIIKAGGSQVAFLEFGAGAEAGVGVYPYTKSEASNDFVAGSWSAEHGGTYQAWVEGGYVGMYIHEQPPARGFDTAISEFPYKVKEAFDEVFK